MGTSLRRRASHRGHRSGRPEVYRLQLPVDENAIHSMSLKRDILAWDASLSAADTFCRHPGAFPLYPHGPSTSVLDETTPRCYMSPGGPLPTVNDLGSRWCGDLRNPDPGLRVSEWWHGRFISFGRAAPASVTASALARLPGPLEGWHPLRRPRSSPPSSRAAQHREGD